jgi:hypothetical protein
MRKHAKKDANHNDIVRELRACGCKVAELHQHGDGIPDTVVAHPAGTIMLWVEIKTDDGELTPAEMEFFADWPQETRMIARTTDDVLRRLGMIA